MRGRSPRRRSAEEVRRRRTNEIAPAADRRAPLEAADEDGGRAAVLFHQETRRRGQLIGDGEDRMLQVAARKIGAAAAIEQRTDAGDAERDGDLTVAPRQPERVADD